MLNLTLIKEVGSGNATERWITTIRNPSRGLPAARYLPPLKNGC